MYSYCNIINIKIIMYLDRRVVGSFITITSVISPNLLKYSLSDSVKQNKTYLLVTVVYMFNILTLSIIITYSIYEQQIIVQ